MGRRHPGFRTAALFSFSSTAYLRRMVQLKVAEPDAVPEVAVTVTVEVPVVVGVPVISPEELIDRPAGRPDAE